MNKWLAWNLNQFSLKWQTIKQKMNKINWEKKINEKK